MRTNPLRRGTKQAAALREELEAIASQELAATSAPPPRGCPDHCIQ